MSSQIFEQLPPRLEAVQFNGSNVEELIEFADADPTPITENGENGLVVTLQKPSQYPGMAPMRFMLSVSDWLTRQDGQLGVRPDTELSEKFRKVT